jgi:hypothetical protein
LLNIKSTRVSIMPVDKDTMKICSGRHKAYLLGYANDAHFVLLIPFLFEEGQFESPDLPPPPVTSPPPLLDPRRSQQPQEDDPSTSLPEEEDDTTNLSFGYPQVFRLPEDDYEMIRSLEYRNEKVEYGDPCASPRRAS